MRDWDKLTSTQIRVIGGITIPTEKEEPNLEFDDVEDALRRADELAELTGRSKADVIADLLDDGQLNQSAGADSEPQKDILDIAQEKAEKLKTLLITIAPILALLSGIGLEGLGVLDVTGWGEDSVWDGSEGNPNDPTMNAYYWGCTDYQASNFDSMANQDDGSCFYDSTPPDDHSDPNCMPDWSWSGTYTEVVDNRIVTNGNFQDTQGCEKGGIGNFYIELLQNGEVISSDMWQDEPFDMYWYNTKSFDNLDAGTYQIEWRMEMDGNGWTDGQSESFEITNPCNSLEAGEATARIIADSRDIEVDIKINNPRNDCSAEVEIMISGYHDNGWVWTIENSDLPSYTVGADGYTTITIFHQKLMNLDYGSWSFETRFIPIGQNENCCTHTNTVEIVEPIQTHCDSGDITVSNTMADLGSDNMSVDVAFTVSMADGPEVDCTGGIEIDLTLEKAGMMYSVVALDEPSEWDGAEVFYHTFENLESGEYKVELLIRNNLSETVGAGSLNQITVPAVECETDFYEKLLQYQSNGNESNTRALQLYTDPDEVNGCGQEITVLVVWQIYDENGTEVSNLNYTLNTSGVNWDQMWLYSENLSVGNYSSTLELYLYKDGIPSTEPCKTYTWSNIEIKD